MSLELPAIQHTEDEFSGKSDYLCIFITYKRVENKVVGIRLITAEDNDIERVREHIEDGFRLNSNEKGYKIFLSSRIKIK